MKSCSACGGSLVRIHRRWYERLIYRVVLECRECGSRNPRRRWMFRGPSRTARCPKCGNRKLEVFKKRDHIELYHRRLFRTLQGLLGAKLCYCAPCRLQFYDARPFSEPRRTSPRRTSEVES